MEESPTKKAAVGASGMDREHELMERILGELEEAVGDRSEQVAELLDRFEALARMHFMEEQVLMRLHAYPAYEEHQREHDELLDDLGEIGRRIQGEDPFEARKAVGELEHWHATHVATTDEAFAEFMREQGIRPGDGSKAG